MDRVLFMGTPAFAVPALHRLAEAGYALTVVTQPDRPAGRGRALAPPAVKLAAQELDLPLWQPPTLRDPAVVARIQELAPAAIVVVAYGEILRRAVLETPPHGCLNLHASLLPRWRGAIPINAAILAGDAESGVSVIAMDAGMDSGPLLAQAPAPLYPDDTAATLGARLAGLGAPLLVATLGQVLRGTAQPWPQDSAAATVCRPLRKEDGRIVWQQADAAIERQVRAYDPWPGTFTTWGDRRLKILGARLLPAVDGAGAGAADPPGTVRLLRDLLPAVDDGAHRPAVRCGGGWIELTRLQLEGKPAAAASIFLRGYPALAGARLQ